MTEPEREELAELHRKVDLMERFINYHWGEPWRQYREASELSNHRSVKRSPPPELLKDAYIDAGG